MGLAPTAAREALLRGARLFDAGAFFDAHEAWEEHWRVETDAASRLLFQGLIQIAAAFHKLVAMRDRASASRLLAKGLAKLDACPEAVAELSLGRFRDELRAIDLERDDPPRVPSVRLV